MRPVFGEVVLALVFLPYRTVTFPIPPDPHIIIFDSIKQVYIINFWIFLYRKIKGIWTRGPRFLWGLSSRILVAI